MSKGITCDVCRKTTNVPDYDRTCALPAEFTGWYHIDVSRRIIEDGNPFDKLLYSDIDICPKCAKKIRSACENVSFDHDMYERDEMCAWDLIGEIFDV